MQKLNVHEAKTKLSAVIAEIEKTGKTFIICRNGKPAAELIPYRRHNRLKYHPALRKIKINFDPIEDLADSEWGEIE